MQTTKTQERRAELFEALSLFERDAQLTQETQAHVRALREALVREEADECGPPNRKRYVAHQDVSDCSSRSGAERIPSHDQGFGLVLRPFHVRAA